MRTVMFSTAVLAGVVSASLVPANAAPQPMPGIAVAKAQFGAVEEVAWRRRYYRRYAYTAPYAYYPPAYGYYPPPAYAYYAPVYPAYPYYAPWRKQLGYLSARTKDVRALSRDQNPR